ncbi:uncharacterized protein LOC135395053 [Ornithodoros turicata]|uniref:uncharacterized protein LOC135395053 n=1 Tax=Ornithodoros turicata TaxID=34597 RepID=UPI0031396277
MAVSCKFLWLLGFILLPLSSTSPQTPWVRGPAEYIALSGDLLIDYEVASNTTSGAVIRVVDSQGIPLSKTDVRSNLGHVIFPCGIVHKAGDYHFEIAQGDTVMARSPEVTKTRWPASETHVPLLLESYSSDAVVALEFPSVKCSPLQQDDYGFDVTLVYQGSSHPGLWKPEVLAQERLGNWKALWSQHITFDCQLFDRPGFYQVQVLCADDQSLPAVSESVLITVLKSPQYAINIVQNPISSCHSGINVVYRYPTTCGKGRDKVRVYGRRSGQLEYLFEQRLPMNKHAITLGCHLFPDGYEEFCFMYVGVARNGAVFELAKVCRPADIQPDSKHSDWGAWSEWSPCTGSCGKGTQVRYRLCSSHAAYCSGNAYDSRTCILEPCPATTTTSTLPTPGYCSCGCTFVVFRSESVQFRGSLCGNGPVTWILRPLLEPGVTVHFLDVQLEPYRQRLIVRGGESPVATLLAVISGSDSLSVTSDRGPIRVDFMDSNATASQDDGTGFNMTFWGSGTHEEATFLASRHTILSPIHVTLTVLATAVFSALFIFLIIYRKCRQQPSESLCSVDEGDETTKLLRCETLTSEVSALCPTRASKAIGQSPEDYMEGSNLFEQSEPSKKVGAIKKSVVSLVSSDHKAASSFSELSVAGTEDGLELDYYDYGCHDLPGSYFSALPEQWPPFIPSPNMGEDEDALELQLQKYTLPPPETDLYSMDGRSSGTAGSTMTADA